MKYYLIVLSQGRVVDISTFSSREQTDFERAIITAHARVREGGWYNGAKVDEVQTLTEVQ